MDKYQIPEMEDGEYAALTDEQQRQYNRKIDLKNTYNAAKADYETSMSLWGPSILIIIGVPGIVLVLFGLAQFLIGLIPVFVGIVWAFYRVAARSQAYQRYRDAESELRVALVK